jgi:hypothetical protein
LGEFANTFAKNQVALAWILPISAAWKTLSSIKNASPSLPQESCAGLGWGLPPLCLRF